MYEVSPEGSYSKRSKAFWTPTLYTHTYKHDFLQSVMWRYFAYNKHAAAAPAKSLQSCPTLCDPIDGSPPGSPVSGNLQARTLEWVAISFSSAWKWKNKVKSLSRVRLPATPWTAAHQAPLSMGFSRQGYWSGVYNKHITILFQNFIMLTSWTYFFHPGFLHSGTVDTLD